MENNEQIQTESNLINLKLENIDISNIESIILIPNNYKKIQIKTDNFYKIVKFIITNTGKTEFLENELLSIYNYILKNYKTETDQETYSNIKEVLNIFVKNGGNVEIKYLSKNDDKLESSNKEKQETKITFGKIVLILFLLILIFSGTFLAFCGGSIMSFGFMSRGSINGALIYVFLIMPIIYLFVNGISNIIKRKLNYNTGYIILMLSKILFFLYLAGMLIDFYFNKGLFRSISSISEFGSVRFHGGGNDFLFDEYFIVQMLGPILYIPFLIISFLKGYDKTINIKVFIFWLAFIILLILGRIFMPMSWF